MNKPFIYYTALTKAVENYNKRHNYKRGHLADLLGFVGPNAANQFSNALNPINHDKILNDEKKYTLLYALDPEDRIVFFTHYMRQFGLKPVPINTPVVTFTSLHHAADNAMIEGDEAFKTIKLSLRDKTLDRDELKDIIKETTEAEHAHAQTRIMAQARLDEMEGPEDE